jgi:anti-sigma-K factor RskA
MVDASVGAGSYVLDAMDESEREEFEFQLALSEDLRDEVTELLDTAVLLGLAVTPVTPASALKQNIMARLDQLPQIESEEPVLALETHPGAQARWYRRPAIVLTAAAAAVVLIFGGVIGTSIAIQGAPTSQQAAALAAITTAPDARRTEAVVSTGGTVTLVWSRHLKMSALMGKGITVLPSSKTYELWYINSAGTATPAGLFESNGSNTERVLSGTLTVGDTIGVTVEPAGGSKTPTTKPIVAITTA